MDVDGKNILEKQSVEEEREQVDSEDELDERLLLTPEDQEKLLKEIAVEGELEGTRKTNKGFEEEVSDKLGELHKQKELNIDIALQTIQVQLGTSTQGIQILEQEEEEKDEAEGK